MAAIAVKIEDDRPARVPWQGPGQQRQPVFGRQNRLAHAELFQACESWACLVGEIEQLALKEEQAADQHRVGDEPKSEEWVQHAGGLAAEFRRQEAARLRSCAA